MIVYFHPQHHPKHYPYLILKRDSGGGVRSVDRNRRSLISLTSLTSGKFRVKLPLTPCWAGRVCAPSTTGLNDWDRQPKIRYNYCESTATTSET